MLSFIRNIFGGIDPAVKAALEKGAIIIDVRTIAEFKNGHIEGSKNIPLHEIKARVPAIKNWNKPIVTVCLSGSRSKTARNILASEGIEVYNGGPWMNFRR